MKKFFLLIFLLLIISGVAFFKFNTDPEVILKGSAVAGTSEGQELSYQINLFAIFPMGNARFYAPIDEKYKGKDTYHLRAVAQSLDYLSSFFSGSAFLDSYIDTKALNPVMFSQKILIKGKPSLTREVSYDQKNGVITTFKGERAIPPDTLEPLSAIFRLRRMNFDKTNDFRMFINTNQKTYVLSGVATRKTIRKGAQTFRVVRVKADIRRQDKDNPYHRTKMEMYLLQDKENLPFMINVVASGVFINVRLK